MGIYLLAGSTDAVIIESEEDFDNSLKKVQGNAPFFTPFCVLFSH